ncbi:MAG: SDR family oxidoreductase [Proteobacteria bacterium]|nr:SDR family oxidoreductase [Pseudomonadota bacterium]MDA1355145.1 SDR family oxidoreductase [Pseudomonadota bacterium]
MTNKNFLVSGGTDGIGRITATELARTGGEVILVGRDRAKAERVVAQIKRDSGNERVGFELADLSSQDDIRALANRLNDRLEHLDVLVNNVGAWFQRRQLSVDGIEMTFALSHLGYFLLTGLLLEKLKRAPAARIVNVSSIAHRGPQIDFDDPQGAERFSGWRAYHASKLANIHFTLRLAEMLDGGSVTVNCLHPGFVASKFAHNNGGWLKWLMMVVQQLVAISETKGARTSVHLATANSVAGVSGKYFNKCKIDKSSAESHDKEARERLWQLSEELTGFSY